jgi:hypothetical protein
MRYREVVSRLCLLLRHVQFRASARQSRFPRPTVAVNVGVVGTPTKLPYDSYSH